MHTTPATSQLSELVASEIRAEMGRRGITQSILAERLGENPAWVSRRITSGTRKLPLDLDELERVADALGLSAPALIERATAVPA